jgi:hypothetical protein
LAHNIRKGKNPRQRRKLTSFPLEDKARTHTHTHLFREKLRMILETLNTLQKIGGVTKRDKNRTEQKKKEAATDFKASNFSTVILHY